MERLVVGLVRGLHGLRGAVRVEPLTDVVERFAPGSRLGLEGQPIGLTVAWSQADGPGLLVRFEEIADRSAATELRERYLEADIEVGALPAGSFWWHELDDVAVLTTEGEALGRVADVFRAGGGEVLVVRGGPRGELYVPALTAFVRELAPHEGRIVVDAAALDLPAPSAARAPRPPRSPRRRAPRPARRPEA